MNNENFNFWKMAFDMGAIDISILKQAVKTDSNPFGEISEDQFKEITGVDFATPTIQPQQTPPVTQPVTPVKPQQVTQ